MICVQFESILMDPSLLPRGEEKGGMTRLEPVPFLCIQNKRHYQAAPHSFQLVYGAIVENLCPVFHIVISSIDIQFIL